MLEEILVAPGMTAMVISWPMRVYGVFRRAGFKLRAGNMARFGRLRDGHQDGVELLSPEPYIAAGADRWVYAQNAGSQSWTPGASYRSQWYVFSDLKS